jgi:hypothetical protein
MKTVGYTLVQHSAYGWGDDNTFARGVEVVGISKSEKKIVENSGGIVFDDYMEADDFSFAVMYPDNTIGGIIPMATGGFGPLLNGLKIYVLSQSDWAKTSRQVTA